MTCPYYNFKDSFWSGQIHICESNKKEIDNNHAEKFCLTEESQWNSNPYYNDCPYKDR